MDIKNLIQKLDSISSTPAQSTYIAESVQRSPVANKARARVKKSISEMLLKEFGLFEAPANPYPEGSPNKAAFDTLSDKDKEWLTRGGQQPDFANDPAIKARMPDKGQPTMSPAQGDKMAADIAKANGATQAKPQQPGMTQSQGSQMAADIAKANGATQAKPQQQGAVAAGDKPPFPSAYAPPGSSLNRDTATAAGQIGAINDKLNAIDSATGMTSAQGDKMAADIAKANGAPATGAAPSAAPATNPVAELQTALNAKGAGLTVDGKMGPLTSAAMKKHPEVSKKFPAVKQPSSAGAATPASGASPMKSSPQSAKTPAQGGQYADTQKLTRAGDAAAASAATAIPQQLANADKSTKQWVNGERWVYKPVAANFDSTNGGVVTTPAGWQLDYSEAPGKAVGSTGVSGVFTSGITKQRAKEKYTGPDKGTQSAPAQAQPSPKYVPQPGQTSPKISSAPNAITAATAAQGSQLDADSMQFYSQSKK